MANICGIVPCNQPVAQNQRTCSNTAHQHWFKAYQDRFSRLEYPHTQRVIRRQQAQVQQRSTSNNSPLLHVQLPELEGTAGNDVVHTFRARTVYCVETIQWACRMPIGWAKCYNSESSPQVLTLLNTIWPGPIEE